MFYIVESKSTSEMRISVWSSDVCSTDLRSVAAQRTRVGPFRGENRQPQCHRLDKRQAETFIERGEEQGICIGILRAHASRVLQADGHERRRQAASDSFERQDDQRFAAGAETGRIIVQRSEEHTSELQSLMSISYAVFCLKKKNNNKI